MSNLPGEKRQSYMTLNMVYHYVAHCSPVQNIRLEKSQQGWECAPRPNFTVK